MIRIFATLSRTEYNAALRADATQWQSEPKIGLRVASLIVPTRTIVISGLPARAGTPIARVAQARTLRSVSRF